MPLSGLEGDQAEGDWDVVSAGIVRIRPDAHSLEIVELRSRRTNQRIVVTRDCHTSTLSVTAVPEPVGEIAGLYAPYATGAPNESPEQSEDPAPVYQPDDDYPYGTDEAC